MAKSPAFPELDPGRKRTTWETIIVTTPVILTVVATVLAGLSSSEMSSAQYYRSLAAQMQAKVSDQWGYFQAKKMKAEQCLNTVEIIQSLSTGGVGGTAETTTAPDAVASYLRGDIPDVPEQPIGDPQIADAISALNSKASEAALEQQAGGISQEAIDKAMDVANENSAAFESALEPATKARSAMEKGNRGLARQVSISRMEFNSNRYNREANYNQVLAELMEIEVRRQGFTSDRHRVRSKEFFYGMLGAQAGVTIATFSLAVRKRNLLWGLAASAGLAAVTFAAYVYMFV